MSIHDDHFDINSLKVMTFSELLPKSSFCHPPLSEALVQKVPYGFIPKLLMLQFAMNCCIL